MYDYINQTLCIEDTCIDYLLVENLVIDVDTTFKAIVEIQLDNVSILPLTKLSTYKTSPLTLLFHLQNLSTYTL